MKNGKILRKTEKNWSNESSVEILNFPTFVPWLFMTATTLQHAIIGSYLQEFRVKKIIWHDNLQYGEIVIKYGVLFVLVAWCALFFDLFESINEKFLQWAFSFIVLIIYIVCFYELLNKYLDALVISEEWLILFQRHSPFAQTISLIQRVAIESIEHAHTWFWSSLFNLWTLRIQVEDSRYVFNRITKPAHTLQLILKAKDYWTKMRYTENMPPQIPQHPINKENKETYSILIEALGEVMEEYVKKKQ